MQIAIDAMGGDRAPAVPVAGAVLALREFADVEMVLVGAEEAVRTELAGLSPTDSEMARLRVVDAPYADVTPQDSVITLRSQEGHPARVCAELLREGEIQGVVTMGSTAAAVAAAQLYCGRLKGVRRPGLAVAFPRPGGATIVMDVGANAEARPEDLYQFAVMASLYAQAAFDVEEPRVGILSIGEEEHKGNRLVKDTWALFREVDVPGFVGNVEPREFFEDRADVVVGDGFSGNVALKAAEGMAGYLLGALYKALPQDEAGAALFQKVRSRTDYSQYGGVPLLGVRGAYLIGHGRSDATAIVSAVRMARAHIVGRVGERIVEAFARSTVAPGTDPEGA